MEVVRVKPRVPEVVTAQRRRSMMRQTMLGFDWTSVNTAAAHKLGWASSRMEKPFLYSAGQHQVTVTTKAWRGRLLDLCTAPAAAAAAAGRKQCVQHGEYL